MHKYIKYTNLYKGEQITPKILFENTYYQSLPIVNLIEIINNY